MPSIWASTSRTSSRLRTTGTCLGSWIRRSRRGFEQHRASRTDNGRRWQAARMADRLWPVGRGPRVYEKHDPFAQALHQAVRENLATFYAAIEEGWQTGLPDFVRAEFAGYLDCSVMQGGFAHLACEDCGLARLVVFTCAGRGFC